MDISVVASPLLLFVWIAVICDVRERSIPNLLTFTGLAVSVVLHLSVVGPSGLLPFVSGLLIGGAMLLPGYMVGVTGAGDVKLMAAVGSFFGASGAFAAALSSIVMGGVIALVFMLATLLSADSVAPWRRYGMMLKTLATTGRPVYLAPEYGEVMGKRFPFAISIAVGTTAYAGWKVFAVG
jgi:prepilin peptidase CpaA